MYNNNGISEIETKKKESSNNNNVVVSNRFNLKLS